MKGRSGAEVGGAWDDPCACQLQHDEAETEEGQTHSWKRGGADMEQRHSRLAKR